MCMTFRAFHCFFGLSCFMNMEGVGYKSLKD